MSKSVATIVSSCRMHSGWLCVALSALTLLPPVNAVAAIPDPALRRSEQLDMSRLGRVSADERSVLRVEWRATVAGDEEARAVQEMLDSLRRMEGTVGEINRLIRSMPAANPVIAAVAAEPSGSSADARNMALAAGAAIGLLGLWWSRRRHSAKHPVARAGLYTVPEANLSAADSPDGPLPVMGPSGETPATEEPPAGMPTPSVHGPLKVPGPHETNIEPTLQLAEIMLSMGLEQGAAQALLEYAEAQPRNAVYHWLKLLGIYRKSGHREGFKATAEKLRRHFNIQADDWTKAGTGEAPTLEKFARVAEHVQQIWPRPEECIAYLRHLLEDNRDGERLGFPQPVAEEFLLLIEILKQTSGLDQAVGT